MKCGKEILSPDTEYCEDCAEKRHLYLQGYPLLNYVPPVSFSLAAMKYRKRPEYAESYGKLMGKKFGDTFREIGVTRLIPVPVHRHRMASRGYNQAALLAGAISRETGIPAGDGLLRRISDTRAQKSLNDTERARNLRGAFATDERFLRKSGIRPAEETIMLVDDIYTTGATIDCCSGTLLEAGFRKIYYTSVCIGKK